MSTSDVDPLSRRRFLYLAAVASGLGGLAACGSGGAGSGSARALSPPTSPGSSSGSPSAGPSATGSRTSSVSSHQAAAPQALRGHGERRKPGDPAAAREALTSFGIDFLREAMHADPGPNTTISPYSLFTVLAMVRAGAKGETAAQIDSVLHAAGVDAQGAVISAVDAGIEAALTASEQHSGTQEPLKLATANQTWVQNGLAVSQEYLDALAVQYGVEAMAADFAADPEAMRAAINGWVRQRTNNLILELFPDGSIRQDTVLVLVNALYFKGAWNLPFNRLTGRPFTTATGSDVTVPMMSTIKPVPGVVGDGWTAVSIPYIGGQAVMTLLVPDHGRYSDVVEQFDASMLTRAAHADAQVQLTTPTFGLRSQPDARAIAEKLGIVDLFGPAADLSGIAPGLVADAFVHQAVVKVDENGTEAAAASGIAIAESAPMIDVDVVVDRPFLFWISETTTGAPLFLGAVTDPSKVA